MSFCARLLEQSAVLTEELCCWLVHGSIHESGPFLGVRSVSTALRQPGAFGSSPARVAGLGLLLLPAAKVPS